MSGEEEVRRSRRLLGNPPEIFSTPLLRIREDARNEMEQPTAGTSSSDGREKTLEGSTSVITKRSGKRSIASGISSACSEATRMKLKAKIESMQRLGKVEEEFALAKIRLLREKQIEEKRLHMEKLQLEDEFGEELEDNCGHDPEDVPKEPLTDPNENVRTWLQKESEQRKPTEELRNTKLDEMTMNTRLDRLLSRQSVPKDLPLFNGDPEEWPMFLQQFERTTKLCGLSTDENIVRLQKCLRGKARDAVLPILGLPGNVHRIMDTLKLMFGRSDQIIRSMIEKVKTTNGPVQSKPETLIMFSNLVSNLVATMKSLNQLGHMYNPELLERLVLKLPVELQYQWCQLVKQLVNEPSLGDFDWWLNEVATVASLMPVAVSAKETPAEKPKKDKKSVLVTVSKEDKSCFHCSGQGHRLEDCKQFIEAELQNKWKTVKTARVCYCCLSPGHRSSDCKKKRQCGQDDCEKIHHKLLHKPAQPKELKPDVKVESVCGHFNSRPENVEVLLRILPVKLFGPKGVLYTYAMLDEGSTLTMVEASVPEDLGITGPVVPLCMQWTGEFTNEQPNSQTITLELSGTRKENKKYRLHNVRTVENLALPTQSVDMTQLRAQWPYMKDVPFDSLVNAKPLILIGSDNILASTSRKIRQGHWQDPIATKTWLGWVVHGNLPRRLKLSRSFNVHICTQEATNQELTELIKESFSTESFGVRVCEEQSRSKDDQRALELLQKTTRRVGDRFETGLLWRSDDIKLPESRSNAWRRLQCMEKKMDRDPTFAEAYCGKIDEYIKKGYCRRLSPKEVGNKGPRTNYIPHFAVFNVHKGKLRLVFDAAAKNHGVSLNDCLLKGPDLLSPLPAVLMRFRRHVHGIVGDIREMFHQIRIIPEDVDSQRFLWRGKDRTSEPGEFVMQVMIFGASCSPCSALWVKNVNAKEFVTEFPETSVSAISNTYIDDNLHGAKTEEEAKLRISEAVELFSRGGFQICNWASSSRVVIEAVAPELRSKNLVSLREKEGLPIERILGMKWDPEDDVFTYEVKFPRVKDEVLLGMKVPTKREMSALISSVYDPLGLLVNFTIKARILFQEVWLCKMEWDEIIPSELYKSWKWWISELANITRVRVPRCYSPYLGEANSVRLHVFVDASERAFAAAVYLTVNYIDKVSVAFVTARARVAPLKTLSIPRLELQAAVMGSRLALTVRKEIEVEVTGITYWSDSRTVLSWIRSDSRRFKQFVAHRIGEIHEASEICEWRWVPTDYNVADEATRSVPEIDFSPESRWYNGPEFLKLPENEWPVENPAVIKDGTENAHEELKKEHVHLVTVSGPDYPVPDASRFSSWLKLVRTTAWVTRFLKVRENPRPNGELTGEEVNEAQVVWWREVQQRHFSEELKALKAGLAVSSKSSLVTLSPFIDEHGVLRVKGRLGQAEGMKFGMKHPVILSSKHRYVQLLITHLHQQAAHQGVETVLSQLRLIHWVTGARAAVKKVFYYCQWCKVKKVMPSPPEMGSLPPERLNVPEGPFTYTGVDFFGPLMVTILRKQVKRYGVLFTCLSTRAIHLEVAPDLTTDATINAIRRFIARRTVPKILWSDNGTNFHGADRELQKAIKEIDRDEVMRTLSGRGMTWKFNPPASPHMGGAWERMVKSVKIALRATLKESAPKEDVLQTLFAEAEYIVNNRPLTHVSVDAHDPDCLTPNHFLRLGQSTGINVPGKFGEGKWNHRSQWRLLQELADTLWRRWVQEYLPTLTRRVKWCSYTTPIKIGDVVVVVDKDAPRNSWPLGRIVQVYPGNDGQVRVVDVRTKYGTYKRPATKICVLDIHGVDDKKNLSSGGRTVEAMAREESNEENESGSSEVRGGP